jgi:putative nucleotidyltransferase with HDIG domain
METSAATIDANPERVDLILSELDQLPTLPAVAARVLQATTSERTSAAEVIRLIESDQSLSAKILKLVHQASRGAPRDIHSVDKAVVLLGFNAVRHAVLSLKIFDTFSAARGSAAGHFDRREFWKHSLAVGCLSRLIAEHWPGHVDPEVAFVCGLLHDVGKVALDACLPKSYDRVVSVALKKRACILDVEQELLGVDHTVAGKRLAQRWKLPSEVVECAWLHHHTPDMLPDSVANPDVVQIVCLADTMAREQRLGFSGFLGDSTPSSDIARQMGMPVEYLERVIPRLLTEIQERAELLGLNDLSPGEVFARAVGHVNLELRQLNEELAETNRQLKLRTRCLELIHRFNCELDTSVSIGDVCRAAADCARAVLEVPAALVFVNRPGGTLFHMGLVDGAGSATEVLSVAEATQEGSGWRQLTNGIFAAPADTAPLRACFGDRAGPGAWWVLPVIKDRQCWGGVLFPADDNQAQVLSASSGELATFSMAVGLAVVRSFERTQLERLNEGLAKVNRQLKVAQAELLRRRSLAMIAEMAAGAAHELNNPLAVIAGRSQLLARTAADDRVKQEMAVIGEQARRCSEIVDELMDFAKPDPPQRRRFKLGEAVALWVAHWIEQGQLSRNQVNLEISDEAYVEADPRQIQGVFDELLRNALSAAPPESRQLTINCGRGPSDDRVALTVTDNGQGMPPEVLEKARDPFFSHRSAGRGRGLGLSRAARWCEINGGVLRLSSEVGEGTTACVELPLPPQRDTRAPTPSA